MSSAHLPLRAVTFIEDSGLAVLLRANFWATASVAVRLAWQPMWFPYNRRRFLTSHI